MGASDWLAYNEVLCSAHSCAIEGNSFTVDETRELKERGLGVVPVGKTLLEAFEILDHFRAYEYVISKAGEPMTEELLLEVHRLVTLNTIASRTGGEAHPGEYTTVDMAAGDTMFGDHEMLISQVPRLLESTQRQLEADTLHPLLLAARFHCFFEFLHPFRDGNGRTGRLMANFILLSKQHPVVIIRNEDRQEYISALRFYKKERSTEAIEQFFINTAIERMQREIEEKQTLTRIL